MDADEFHPLLARIRIAALQSEVKAKNVSPNSFVVRARRNKVATTFTADGTPSLAKRRVVSARRS